MPAAGRVTYRGPVRNRLTDLGIAAIPVVLGLTGLGAHGAGGGIGAGEAAIEQDNLGEAPRPRDRTAGPSIYSVQQDRLDRLFPKESVTGPGGQFPRGRG